METKANFVLIGAFTLAGFAAILGFLMWFAKIEMNQQFAQYDIYFSEVSGLGSSSSVTFAGLPVGRVVDMQITNTGSGAVRVRIEIAQDTPVRVDSRASIMIQGVTGVANVAVTAGSGDAPLLRVATPEGVPVIPADRSALQTLTDQGPEMISRLNTVAEQMTRLLSDENQQHITQILENVERSSANLDKALTDVTRATDAVAATAADFSAFGARLDSLGKAAEDTLAKADQVLTTGNAALGDMRAFVSGDLRDLTATAGEGVRSFSAMMEGARAPVQAFTREGLPQFTLLARDLRALTGNLNQLVNALRRNPSQIITGPRTPEFRR